MVATLVTVRLFDEAFGFLSDGSLESWRTDLGLDYRHAAIVLAAAAPGAIAGSVLSIAADHRSRRAVASFGGLVFALSLFAFGLGHSVTVLAASSFAFGFGSSGLVDGIEVALVDLADTDHVGDTGDSGRRTLEDLLARTNLLGSVGDLLGPALVAATAALGWSWRVPFLACGSFLVAYSLWVAALPLPGPHPVPDGESRRPWRDVLDIARDGRAWRLGIIALLFTLLDETFLAFTIAFTHRVHHTAIAVATLVGSTLVAGGVAGYALASRRRHSSSARRVLTMSAVALTASAAVMATAPSLALLALAALAFGFASAWFWNTLQALTLRLRPGRSGTVSAVVGTIEFAGFPLPVAIGWLADHAGLRAAMFAFVAVPAALVPLVVRAPDGSGGQARR